MDKLVITQPYRVSSADLNATRIGPRFPRMDLASQLALTAASQWADFFDTWPRDWIGICMAVKAGSLSTDIEYWKGHNALGGPSPTLFTYTLPSAALGEIAIHHKLTGPNLCFVGDHAGLLHEAGQLIHSGEAEACLCVFCEWISPEAATLTGRSAVAEASASFLYRPKARS